METIIILSQFATQKVSRPCNNIGYALFSLRAFVTLVVQTDHVVQMLL